MAIYDEIGAHGVSAKGFLAELGALPEGTPIDLRLNSPGGSVFDAVAIHNAILRHEGTVTVWIDGIAASAASYVAMAGDEIVMPENAFLMIHDPAGLVMGTAVDMRAMAEALDKVKGSLVQGYAAKSGRDAARNRRADGGRDLVRRQGRPRPRACHPDRRAGAHRRPLRHRLLPQCTACTGRGGGARGAGQRARGTGNRSGRERFGGRRRSASGIAEDTPPKLSRGMSSPPTCPRPKPVHLPILRRSGPTPSHMPAP